MTTETKVRILSTLTTRDEPGNHFTSWVSSDDLTTLENDGLIEINRPIHEATGIPYGVEYHSVEVTEEGVALVEAHPEYWDAE
jgi:hypothetical protein